MRLKSIVTLDSFNTNSNAGYALFIHRPELVVYTGFIINDSTVMKSKVYKESSNVHRRCVLYFSFFHEDSNNY